ncbi:facilitated trehalose transporter Tret1-2 homolog isoform X2 [Scylla paramamosain]
MGLVMAACPSLPLQTIMGQRIVIVLGICLNVSAWLAITLTKKIWVLCLARFAQGMCLNTGGPSITTYLVETAHKNNRGWQTGTQYLSRSIGLLVPAITTTANLSWRQTGIVCCVLSLVPIIGILLLPDSPRWLMTRGRNTEAQKALKYFRGECSEIESEYKEIVSQALKEGQGDICHQTSMLFRAPTRRTLSLLFVTASTIYFGGSNLVITYMVPIMQRAKITTDPYLTSIVFFLTRTLGATMSVCLSHRLKRKPLIIVGLISISLSHGMISLYFFLQRFGISDISWMPIAAIIIMLFSDGIGCTGYYTLEGELLPLSCRTIGVLSLKCAGGMSAVLNMMTYEQTIVALEMDGAFLLYGALSAIAPFIIIFCLQETHGVSLEELTVSVSQNDNTVKTKTLNI